MRRHWTLTMNGEQLPLALVGGRVPYARVGGLEVNEAGVVVGGHEVFRLDHPRWDTYVAEIRVAPHPYRPGWIWAVAWSLPMGGQASPLSVDGPLEQSTETRAGALELGRVSIAAGLARYLDGNRPGPETKALAAWLKKGFS